MNRINWTEEFLIRGRPDGSYAAHQVRVEGFQDPDDGTIVEKSRVTEPIDTAQLGKVLGNQQAAELVVAANNERVLREAALEEVRRLTGVEEALAKANAELGDAQRATEELRAEIHTHRMAFTEARAKFTEEMGRIAAERDEALGVRTIVVPE